VYAYLSARRSQAADLDADLNPESYYISEGTYQSRRISLFKHESLILRQLGFQLHVSLPYTLCINYLQALEIFAAADKAHAEAVARRAFAYLNTALLSPQLLYLTHQPPALAVAAIYLAAKDEKVKLPEEEWWEVFDCEREELGFLVVGMLSLENFAQEEKKKWSDRSAPFNLHDVERELSTIYDKAGGA